MKLAGMILGIMGGVIGLISAFAVVVFGAFAEELEMENSIMGLGWAAFLSSILGIVGGSLATAKTRLAGVLCLTAGVLGFIFVSLGYIIAGPLLIIAGILLLLAPRR